MVLSRAKRDAIWPVFEECRAQLASRRLKEVDDAYRDAAHLGATCIMAESRAWRDQRMSVLRLAGYAVESIEPDTRVRAEAHCLLFATMHRAKGLEFRNVIVTNTTMSQGARGEIAPQLICVALTRAKQRAALLTAI